MRETKLEVTIRSDDTGQQVLANITNAVNSRYLLSHVKIITMIVTKDKSE